MGKQSKKKKSNNGNTIKEKYNNNGNVEFPCTCWNEIPYGVYTKLSRMNGVSCPTDDDEDIPLSVMKKLQQPFTERDFEGVGGIEFSATRTTWDDALVMLIRATGLYNTISRPTFACNQDKGLIHSKVYLLMGRSALHLAALSHKEKPIDTLPPPVSVYTDLLSLNGSLGKMISVCLELAISSLSQRALAFVMMGQSLIFQVANDQTRHARPTMATAWLYAAECELMHAELYSYLHSSDAKGARPPERTGPWVIQEQVHKMEEAGEDISSELQEEARNWKTCVPLATTNQVVGSPALYLADYWWGQSVEVSCRLCCSMLTDTLKHLSRYRSLVDDDTKKCLFDREFNLQHEVERRGAAALSNLDAATVNENPLDNTKHREMRELVENVRYVFPGSPFQPTEQFVKSLDVKNLVDPTSECMFRWHIGMMLGAGGRRNWTYVPVMDIYGHYDGMVLGFETFEGPDPDAYYIPPALVLYKLLLRVMAGAGNEERSHNGPPRRPGVLELNFRLGKSRKKLVELLRRVNVRCEMATRENLQWACANNRTDFTSGLPLDMLDEGQHPKTTSTTTVVQPSIIGQLVGIHGLVNRIDLNGRVGKVMKWHAQSGRWKVKLEAVLASESNTSTILFKPTNLIQYPHDSLTTFEYVSFQDGMRSWVPECPDATEKSSMSSMLETFQGIEGSDVGVDNKCAICMENFNTTPEDDSLFDGNVTRLPCGHCFHVVCVMRWITPAFFKNNSAHCPSCRSVLSHNTE